MGSYFIFYLVPFKQPAKWILTWFETLFCYDYSNKRGYLFFFSSAFHKEHSCFFGNHRYVFLYSVEVRFSVFYTGMTTICVYSDHIWKYMDVFPYKVLKRRSLFKISLIYLYINFGWYNDSKFFLEIILPMRRMYVSDDQAALKWTYHFDFLWDFCCALLNLIDDLSLQ